MVDDEHRIAPRRRLLKAGRISFGGGAAIDCTIRNLSETGAALEVTSPVGSFRSLIGAAPAQPEQITAGPA